MSWVFLVRGRIKLNLDVVIGEGFIIVRVVYRDEIGIIVVVGVKRWKVKWKFKVVEGKVMWYGIGLV